MSVKLFQFHTHGVMTSFLFITPYLSCQKSSTGADSHCTSAGKGCTTPAWGREVTPGLSRCSCAASSPSVCVHHIPLTPVQGKQEHLHSIQIIWAPGTLPACSFISLSREASTSQELPSADSSAPPDANLHVVPGFPRRGRASDLSLSLNRAPGNPVLLLGEPKCRSVAENSAVQTNRGEKCHSLRYLQGTDSFSRACFHLHPHTEKPSATGQHSL